MDWNTLQSVSSGRHPRHPRSGTRDSLVDNFVDNFVDNLAGMIAQASLGK